MSSGVTSVSASGGERTVNWGRFALVGLATVIAAVVANVLVFYIGSAFVSYDPQFLPLMGAGPAVMFTVVPAIVAVLLYAALLRFVRNPERVFVIISIVVFIVTLIPDFIYIPDVPGATVGQTTILILMHVVAAIVIVLMLTRLTRTRSA